MRCNLKDLCHCVLRFSSVRNLARLGLTCTYYRRAIFHNDNLWREVVTRIYPHASAWKSIVFEPDEALLLLLDMDGVSGYLESFVAWKCMLDRIESGSLKFYMRVDTTNAPSIVLIGELQEETAESSHTFNDSIFGTISVRSVGLTTLSSDLRRDFYKRKQRSDPGFGPPDRHTNNNGLLEKYNNNNKRDREDDNVNDNDEVCAKQHKTARQRRMIPQHINFKFQRADRSLIPFWKESINHTYCGQVSSDVVYVIDKTQKGPIVITDIRDRIDAFVYRGNDIVYDPRMFASLARSNGQFVPIRPLLEQERHSDNLFELPIERHLTIDQHVTLYRSMIMTVPIRQLYEHYGNIK